MGYFESVFGVYSTDNTVSPHYDYHHNQIKIYKFVEKDIYYGLISVVTFGRIESTLQMWVTKHEMNYSMLLCMGGTIQNKVHTVTYSVRLAAPYDITNSESAIT